MFELLQRKIKRINNFEAVTFSQTHIGKDRAKKLLNRAVHYKLTIVALQANEGNFSGQGRTTSAARDTF